LEGEGFDMGFDGNKMSFSSRGKVLAKNIDTGEETGGR